LPDSIYGRINYLLNKLLYLCRLSLAALYLWQTLSIAMKELPHGFPLVQRGATRAIHRLAKHRPRSTQLRHWPRGLGASAT